MKKILIIICAVMVIIVSACSQSGSISKAFDLVQKNASYEKVFDEIVPILESDNIDELSMEEKCKLCVCLSYFSTEALKSLGKSFDESLDNGTPKNRVLDYLKTHKTELDKAEGIFNETTSSYGQSIYENMTGTAKRIVDGFIIIKSEYE